MAVSKNAAYDNAMYLARLVHNFGQNTAGASTNFGKFVAFTTMQVMSITGALATAGTSTATQWNGTATVTNINGDSFYGIHVFGGTATAQSTATHGPFVISPYNGTSTGTQTSSVGVWVNVALSGTGTTGNVQAGTNTAAGGITLNQGDTFHVLRGTDATAVSVFAMEYAVQPLASVTP